mmetsp:Transcript_39487/g.93704  ORF Transcript_39487/g.93704 Transcript_39487/m.93704 type:complete len:139 (-) Transcript_39487:1739-2155(-)
MGPSKGIPQTREKFEWVLPPPAQMGHKSIPYPGGVLLAIDSAFQIAPLNGRRLAVEIWGSPCEWVLISTAGLVVTTTLTIKTSDQTRRRALVSKPRRAPLVGTAANSPGPLCTWRRAMSLSARKATLSSGGSLIVIGP